MAEYDPAAYGEAWSRDYDRLFESRDDPAAIISALSGLTTGRSVLELGIGTGRLAVPLHDAGWRVAGVEASPAMVEGLKKRAGDRPIEVVTGDIRDFAIQGRFDVVLIAFSTLFLLPDQRSQVACLARAVAHVAEGGLLVVEAFVADHTRWSDGKRLALSRWTADGIEIEAARHDRANQTIEVRYLGLGSGATTVRPLSLRYAWPAEIDLMAELAGARRRARWSDWSGSPYDAGSPGHVSIYALDPPAGP
jgi:SAM-dependent methyltransferase